jgi:hypothetical protein
MITHLTLKLAEAICSGEKVSIETFYKKGKANEYFLFSHHNFYYSYPEWGSKWKDEQICQFHRINVGCSICGDKPDRNYAGVGNIWLIKSNRDRRDFVLFCNSCKNWRNTTEFKIEMPKQLQLLL